MLGCNAAALRSGGKPTPAVVAGIGADPFEYLACYSVAPVFWGGSARQTYRNFSSLDVTTGIFLSRVTRFKAERRFCIFSPFRLLSGILTACRAFSLVRSDRMSATALRCFPLRPCGTSDRSIDA